jgi:hypothetical protein
VVGKEAPDVEPGTSLGGAFAKPIDERFAVIAKDLAALDAASDRVVEQTGDAPFVSRVKNADGTEWRDGR